MDLMLETHKTNVGSKNDNSRNTMSANFQAKWTMLNFPPRFEEIAQLHATFWF